MNRILVLFSFWLCQLALFAQVGGADGEYDPQNPPNPGVRHNVTFVSNGTLVSSFSVASATIISEAPEVSRQGYTLLGWEPALPCTITEDVTFTARWSQNQYAAVFLDSEGSEWSYNLVGYGDPIPVPDGPEKEGYVFTGWTPNVPEAMPDEDLTFTPLYRQRESTDITVTFGSYPVNSWSGQPSTKVITPGDSVTVTATPKANYRFVEWRIDGEPAGNNETLTIKPTANSEVVAVFEYDPQSPANPEAVSFYQALFLLGGDTIQRLSLRPGEAIDVPEVEVPLGYTFSGWTPEVPEVMPDSAMVFTGLLTANVYALIYVVNGEEWARDSVAYGDAISLRQYPVSSSQTFSGWQSDQTYTVMPAHDVTYSATLEDHSVGIRTVGLSPQSDKPFDLQGRPVGRKPASGLYIINGRKVIVRE